MYRANAATLDTRLSISDIAVGFVTVTAAHSRDPRATARRRREQPLINGGSPYDVPMIGGAFAETVTQWPVSTADLAERLPG
jgi:hypothetical protein